MRHRSARTFLLVTILLVTVLLAGCTGEEEPADPPEPGSSSTPTAAPVVGCDMTGLASWNPEQGEPSEPALARELREMMDADQAERTGEVAANNDSVRTDRLREIIEEHGWPTLALVGREGATAAWLIAQHSDQDVAFQREALDLMCAAARTGQADPTELAYLLDRVAVNSDQPQVYGTQVGDCVDGRAVPRPLVDEQRVDERRARIGMEPLADYLAQFDDGCAGGTGG